MSDQRTVFSLLTGKTGGQRWKLEKKIPAQIERESKPREESNVEWPKQGLITFHDGQSEAPGS